MASKDSRRVPGPEKSLPYSLLQSFKEKTFLNKDELRRDGRSATDIRKFYASVGTISQAKGSSYVEVGNTKVVCGVYGPREVIKISNIKLLGQVVCEVKLAPFSCPLRKSPQPDRQQKELSLQLKEALEAVIILEKYPKTQIDVFITVIEDGGALLSTIITAAGLALCHACIEVYDLLVGASALWHNGTLYVDPTRCEEEYVESCKLEKATHGIGRLSVGVMPSYGNGQIVLMKQYGDVTVEGLCQGVNSAVEMSQRIYALVRQTLKNHVEEVIDEDSGD